MKTIFTIMLSLFFAICIAQDKTFVHEATAANTLLNGTVINHPNLNNNPNAKIVFSHRFFPGGVLNPNVTGIWYRASDGRWLIYNEDFSEAMLVGTLFTVFIADQAEVFTHVASVANQGTSNTNTVLDHPLLNGSDPGPYAVFSNYFNPNEIYNNHNHGFTFDTTIFNNRLLYNEGFTPIPVNAAFKVLVVPSGSVPGVTTHDHLSTAANTTGFSTTLDHPDLNSNPDAAFVFSHYYGSFGPSSENNINKVLGALYDPPAERWKIFTEDLSPMPEGVAFDIIIATQEVLGNNDYTLASPIIVYPNPVNDVVNLSTQDAITEVVVYNMLGQEVLRQSNEGNSMQINLSSFPSGNYIARIQVGNVIETTKLIKK